MVNTPPTRQMSMQTQPRRNEGMLGVRYSYLNTDATKERSWLVFVTKYGNAGGVLYGFQRKVDAEIAARVLCTTGIDWNGEPAEITQSIRDYGGRKKLFEFACEHLQW